MNTRFLKLPAFLLGGFVALSFFSGCATVDQKIGLNYAPVDRSFGRHSGEIAVSRITTQPPAKNAKGEWIIGSINNVHGVHQADILSERSMGEWITDALLQELRQAGYTVTYTTFPQPGAPRAVLISDINAFLQVNKGSVSDETKHELKFNVDLFLNGVKAKSFTVASRNSKTLPLSASRDDQEKIMFQSLQDAMLQIIPEIVALTGQQ